MDYTSNILEIGELIQLEEGLTVDKLTNNVGIGTSNPTAKLEVAGDINLSSNGGYYLNGAVTLFPYANDTYIRPYTTSGSINFQNYSGSEAMRITSAGNVGIGTTAPITKLSIGSYAGNRLPYINGTSNTFNANGITVTSSNIANASIGGGLDLTNNTYSVGSFSPLITFSSISQNGTHNNNYAAIYGILAGDGGDGNWNAGHIVFATSASYGASEKVRITSDGNVGIGTTAPDARIHGVNQDFSTAQGFLFEGFKSTYGATSPVVYIKGNWEYNTTRLTDPILKVAAYNDPNGFYILHNGNVGIGTSAPDTLLTLGATTRTDNTAGIKIFRGGSTASYATYGFAGNAVINSVGGDLVIQRESTEVARFTTAGLCFNGDYAAANALDSYEEGTFTATLDPSDSGAFSLSPSTCTYTKIGRQVVVKGLIAISSVSTPVGASITIGGLPFTIINTSSGRGAFSIVVLDASAGYTAATYPTQHTQNATTLIVYANASTIAASDEIMFTATYFV